MAAQPVEDQQAGVVGQGRAGDLEDQVAEDTDDLSGVQPGQMRQSWQLRALAVTS